jgi:hypothetical protein
VSDVLGRKIAALVSENLRPGAYERTFDASNLAGGVYFYRIASGRVRTNKTPALAEVAPIVTGIL